MENAPISSEKDDISIYSEFEEPNRLRLIQEIVKLSPELTKLPRDICFSLWLADISRLEVLADPLLDNAIRCHSIRNLAPDACLIGARPCELHGPRDKDVAYASIERDEMRCILTENDQWGLVPTHIFPRALNGTDGEKTWSFLSMLFSPEKVSVWKRALCETQNGQTRINTERVENYISLHLGPHNLWNRLAFALHPIYLSADKTTLDLQLHCLPLKKNPPKSFRSEKIFTTRGPFFDLLPPDSEGYWPNPHVGFFNWDGQGQLLRTGDMITMTTSDPDNLPLPSWHLLEMQWVFARITAMCGASEPPNEAEC